MPEFNLEDGLICYNWMPLVADIVVDYPRDFYLNWGVESLHDEEIPQKEDMENMEENSIVFAKTDFIINGEFQKNVLPFINKPFNLVTAVSSYHIGRDGDNPEGYKEILENENLQNWFCTNPPNEEHEKIHTLPIGFAEPNRLSSNQRVLKKLRKERKQFEEKANKFFIPWHDQSTNPERHKIINTLKKKEFVDMMQGKTSSEPYMNLIGAYRFTICVQGSGNDTHRLYESLLMGCVPITIDCTVKRLFDDYNLPGYFVESWDEIDEDFYKEVSSKEYDFSNVDKFLQANTHAEKIKEYAKVS
tara:strand:+ start:1199 stop:2107 length:909 start_codon:yes stop_codon:yes gene_type:complete